MKKLLGILLSLAMILGLAACGDANLPAYSQGLNKDGKFDLKAGDIVTLPEYTGVDFGEEFWTVSDEDVQAQLDSIASGYATTEQVTDVAIISGDSVNIDYSGKIDGELFDGGTATGQDVVAGATNFIDDFLDQIIGHMPGETFDIEVTFPDEYPNNPDLAGKDAVFTVTINYISVSHDAEITDEFVENNFKEQYDLATVDELKAYIGESLLKQTQTTLIDEYLSNNSIVSEIPEVVKTHQEGCIRKNYEDTAAAYGVDVNTFVSYYGATDLDNLIEMSTTEIETMSKNVLIYQAIIEDLGIKISNSDVADYFEGVSGSREYSTYQDSYGLPYLKFVAAVEKVTNYITENAVKAQ